MIKNLDNLIKELEKIKKIKGGKIKVGIRWLYPISEIGVIGVKKCTLDKRKKTLDLTAEKGKDEIVLLSPWSINSPKDGI